MIRIMGWQGKFDKEIEFKLNTTKSRCIQIAHLLVGE